MNVLRSLVLAFSTFSSIPVPRVEWKPESMRYLMCFFPFVGACIGLCIWLWASACAWLDLGPCVLSAGVTLLPVALSGGIHMDGFADVVDAQASHAEPQRKREILKDPHMGAFAAVAVASYLIAYFAFGTQLETGWRVWVLVSGLHCASRCLSGMATLGFRKSASTGMLASFGASASKRASFAVLAVELVAVFAVMAWAWLPLACVMLVAALVCLAAVHRFSARQFGGMNGDMAGFFLQVCELSMLVVLVVGTRVAMTL